MEGAMQDSSPPAVEWFATPPRPDIRVIVAVSETAELSADLKNALDRVRELLESEVEGFGMDNSRAPRLIPPSEDRIRPFPRDWAQ
jgi:hypothetical protein